MFPKLRCGYKYRTSGESGVGRHRPIFFKSIQWVILEILETLWITMKEVDSKE